MNVPAMPCVNLASQMQTDGLKNKWTLIQCPLNQLLSGIRGLGHIVGVAGMLYLIGSMRVSDRQRL